MDAERATGRSPVHAALARRAPTAWTMTSCALPQLHEHEERNVPDGHHERVDRRNLTEELAVVQAAGLELRRTCVELRRSLKSLLRGLRVTSFTRTRQAAVAGNRRFGSLDKACVHGVEPPAEHTSHPCRTLEDVHHTHPRRRRLDPHERMRRIQQGATRPIRATPTRHPPRVLAANATHDTRST